MDFMEPHNGSKADVLVKGEAIYLDTLKDELEKTHRGEFVAIDVDTGKHIIDADRLQAIERGHKEFGDKLLYMVQVGNLDEKTTNFRENKNVAWLFS